MENFSIKIYAQNYRRVRAIELTLDIFEKWRAFVDRLRLICEKCFLSPEEKKAADELLFHRFSFFPFPSFLPHFLRPLYYYYFLSLLILFFFTFFILSFSFTLFIDFLTLSATKQ